MKNLLILTLLLMGQTLISQTVKYIIFTSDTEKAIGVSTIPPEDEEDDFRSFFIGHKNVNGKERSVMFLHDIGVQQILTKPISFLNTIEYDDWDLIQGLSWAQIKEKVSEYAKFDQLYFIDRRDFTNSTMTLYEVIPLSKVEKLY